MSLFRRISNSEAYTLDGLYPDTIYYIWLAARSQRGEGATTPQIPVRTKQYGKLATARTSFLFFKLGRADVVVQNSIGLSPTLKTELYISAFIWYLKNDT